MYSDYKYIRKIEQSTSWKEVKEKKTIYDLKEGDEYFSLELN
jgi:hypothetical protein